MRLLVEKSLPNRKRSAKLLVGSTILLALSISMSALITWSALEKWYVKGILYRYATIGDQLRLRLEDSTRFGKNLKQFYGIDRLLRRTQRHLDQETQAHHTSAKEPRWRTDGNCALGVALSDGTLRYSTNATSLRTASLANLASQISKQGDLKGPDNEFVYEKAGGQYRLALPVRDSRAKLAGLVVIGLPENLIRQDLEQSLKHRLMMSLVICAGGEVLLLALLWLFLPKGLPEPLPKKKISFIVFLVLIISQLTLVSCNLCFFLSDVKGMSQKNAGIVASWLKVDLESILANGLALRRVTGLEGLMERTLERKPTLHGVEVREKEGKVSWSATASEPSIIHNIFKERLPLDEWLGILFPGPERVESTIEVNGRVAGTIGITTSSTYLYQRAMGSSLDSLTAVVISLILSAEFLVFIFCCLQARSGPKTRDDSVNLGIIRPAAFLFVFAIDLSMSFLPLHMGKLYEPILGLSKSVIMGLPITVEFIFVGVSILFAGVWNDRRGWHEPFLTGLFLAGLGALYSWLAPNAMHLILARAFAGTGYGLALMASQGFVITHSVASTKAQGLAQLFAGIYAGSICGGAAGALLAERFGYNNVFLFGGVMLFGGIGYAFLFMRSAMKRPPATSRLKTRARTAPQGRFLHFASNRIVLSLMFFSSFPAAIAVVGFLNYFSPIYLSSIGVSQGTIGRILMVYGVSLVYISPFVSRYIDTSSNKKLFVFSGCVVGSLAFFCFYAMDGLLAAVLGVVLLGISSSFVLTSQSAYMLELRVTKELGEGKALGIFRSSSRIGQAVGPIVFGLFMASGSIKTGVTLFGAAYLTTALCFLLLTQRDRKNLVTEKI